MRTNPISRARLAIAALVLLLLAGAISGGSGLSLASAPFPNGALWHDVDQSAIPHTGNRDIVPARYRVVAPDEAALASLLSSAPLETTATGPRNSPAVITLPLPDGTFGRFSFVEAPIMAAPLAAQFPNIKTYLGQGIDDPTATARFDRTQFGFHALVLAASGTVFIDPYQRGDTTHYISYYKQDYLPNPGDLMSEQGIVQSAIRIPHSAIKTPPSGPQLRTYRLALAATGEYTIYHGGTVGGAMAAINTSVNRVVGVYEREFSVRMVLIANNANVVYTDPTTDPYTNSNGFAMLDENQTTLDTVIGPANYDIGHVFSTGGGGVAGLGVVCATGQKAYGVTGSSNPVGDPFDIDYVAHEMGHQYDGNHTFNGTTSNCGGGNRNGSTAWEPGSGSTIMAYAGICGSEDLQPHSDPYFHVGNFDEISAFTQLGGGNACAAITNTGNNPPTVNAGPAYTIPNQTPFKLTGSATDPDGDALTYAWEQFDLGTQSPPNTDNGNRPIFRSFNPVPVPYRFFPRLTDILSNTLTFGEAYPTTNRNLTFRLTARDNRAGAGGVNYDEVDLTVTTTSGPFDVTSPNTAVTWPGGSNQTVTWDVANTTAAPVSCANVDLTLSTDGGVTFSNTLAAGTPNDGTQQIVVPNLNTTTARVMAQCSDNIFLDISDTNFTITLGATATPTMPATPETATPDATATPTACPLLFTDVAIGSTFYENIRCLACRGIINGYSSGCETGNPCFKPGNNVTRGQLAKIVSNSAGFSDPAGPQQFEDVLPGSTFFDFIWRLAFRGIIEGYPCGGPGEPCIAPDNRPYFRPNADITRGQISKIVSEAAGYTDIPGAQQFEDVPPGSTFYDWIWRLADRGIMSGYPCGSPGEPCNPPDNLPYFRPGKNATRGQASKIVANTFFPACTTPRR
jgi:hypothetical protein